MLQWLRPMVMIAALAAEEAWTALKAPIRRLGQKQVPCPVSKPLEKEFYPSAETVVRTACEMLGRPVPRVPVESVHTTFKGPF